MITYRSPDPPPWIPALPLPPMRMRWPSRVPAFTRTSRGSVRSTAPSPWHTGHGGCTLPVPPQRGQATLNFIPPPDCVIWPLPWHCGHVVGVPTTPLPWQLVQVSSRVMFRRITAPRIASQKPTYTWYSRSVPRSGPTSVAAPPRPPPKMLEKISRKPPPPPDRPPAPPRSEKSKPLKSNPCPPRLPLGGVDRKPPAPKPPPRAYASAAAGSMLSE